MAGFDNERSIKTVLNQICALNEEEVMLFMSRFRVEEMGIHSEKNKKKLKRKSANVKKM